MKEYNALLKNISKQTSTGHIDTVFEGYWSGEFYETFHLNVYMDPESEAYCTDDESKKLCDFCILYGGAEGVKCFEIETVKV